MNRVAVKPKLLSWAIKRSGRSTKSLYKKFPKLSLWEKSQSHPTLKQLEAFAKAVYTPVGYFFLDKPPLEELPIADFRKPKKDKNLLSPELLDTVYLCQRRQDWYKNHKQLMGEKPLDFVGSVKPLPSNIVKTAENIRQILNFNINERNRVNTWKEAFRLLIEKANSIGILVMVSGIVENNTQRQLNPKEFRGFALSDSLAPLIFINGQDTKAAQIFTLGHEMAHLWIAQTAVSNSQAVVVQEHHHIESWCNKVSAELLVPLDLLRKEVRNTRDEISFSKEVQRLARYFKVSSLVILRRLYDLQQLTAYKFKEKYQSELKILNKIQKKNKTSGGSFFQSFNIRVNPFFAKALIRSTFEGHTSFRESMNLLGIKKISTLRKTATNIGINV